MTDEKHSTVMVVGGGIGGVTTAIEISEMGYEVILVEKSPSLGGRVSRMVKYFPKLCPPYCGLEMNYRRLRENKNVRVFTLADVLSISGEPGNMDVKVKLNPRYVVPTHDKYEAAIEACKVEVPNEFNYGMDKTKAIHYYHDLAYPMVPVVDPAAKDDPGVKEAIEASGSSSFDLNMEAKEMDFKVGAVVWAAGWKPFDPTPIGYLGYENFQDVIQNVEMERICSVNGPTNGKILRPSDGKEVKKVAFLQCSGSRDVNYLGYCSGVCCLASLKQAKHVREMVEDAEVTIYYIDIRSGRYEDFMDKIRADEKIHLVKGKAGNVTRNDETGQIVVHVEDIASGKTLKEEFDMVVLATGVVPSTKDDAIPMEGIEYDEYGFVTSDPEKTGVFPLGCVKKPVDVSSTVQEATGVAIKAIHTILGG